MKSQSWLVLAAVVGVGLFASRARANDEVDVSVQINAATDFDAPLAAEGSLVQVESYGRCWQPAHVEAGWRPYCNGSWELTDNGWYWASTEPWAWATYHYGRWAYGPRYGWAWVPDTVWAPAWVSWREGGGYVGWAPLPPHVGMRGGAIIAADIDIAPSLFVFVGSSHFHEPVRSSTVIVNNTTIINKTVNITRIKQVQKHTSNGQQQVIINEGPQAEAMSKATAHNFRAVPIESAALQTPVPPSMTKKAVRQQERQAAEPGAPAPTTAPREAKPQENAPAPKHERELPEVIRPRPDGKEPLPHVIEPHSKRVAPVPPTAPPATEPPPAVAPSPEGRPAAVVPDGRGVPPPAKDTDKQIRQDERHDQKEQKKEEKQDRRDGGG